MGQNSGFLFLFVSLLLIKENTSSWPLRVVFISKIVFQDEEIQQVTMLSIWLGWVFCFGGVFLVVGFFLCFPNIKAID